MSSTLLVTDWITVKGPTGISVIQSEPGWLDVSRFQDIAAYVEIQDFVASTTLFIETAPIKDNAWFQTLLSFSPATGQTGLQTVQIARWASGSAVPPANWLRWRVFNSGAAWSMTFRAYLNCNPNPAGR